MTAVMEQEGQKHEGNDASSCNIKEDFYCKTCQTRFPSKNALFKHLRLNVEKCLPESDVQYLTRGRKEERVAVLYGYRIAQRFREQNIIQLSQVNYSSMEDDDIISTTSSSEYASVRCIVSGGESASQLLLEAIQIVSASSLSLSYLSTKVRNHEFHEEAVDHLRIRQLRATRSYGYSSRNTSIVAQDDHTPACTEVLTARIPPFRTATQQGYHDETDSIQLNEAIQQWVMEVNTVLLNMLQQSIATDTVVNGSTTQSNETVQEDYGRVVVYGCMPISKKFNAELDLTLRKVEYILPVDFFFQFLERYNMPDTTVEGIDKTQRYCDSLLTFQAGDLNIQPDLSTLRVLTMLKKLMQRFTTHCSEKSNISFATTKDKCSQTTNIVSSTVIAPASRKGTKNVNKKNRNCKPSVNAKDSTEEQQQPREINKEKITGSKVKDKPYILRRKRYHNFTPHVMAHEFLAFRRMDRFYHAATERFDGLTNETVIKGRPFLTVSLLGDIFLTGQIQGVVGLLIAICKGVIEDDILECIFDEEYPVLVPAPVAPFFGIISREANYAMWEGRAKAILTPRMVTGFDQREWSGWRSEKILHEIEALYCDIKKDIVNTWLKEGVDPVDGRLLMEKLWTEKVLLPWAAKAVSQLEDYRLWKSKKNNNLNLVESMHEVHLGNLSKDAYYQGPILSVLDKNVPFLFENVLNRLRTADASGLWPKTTPKRQLVMVSNSKTRNSGVKPLTQCYAEAKVNYSVDTDDFSAYSFVEGEGGASGSFTLGAMPGHQCLQPKGNKLFPELMKAAFELELALSPEREPSSTIAINRNAQFRPHTDNGAGSGQSNSLIVGLGNYVGGELVVEGVKHNIRYKPVEFNGWTERHWTLPFHGERYSLVWFTPKGCEGIRGIDLCVSL